MFEKSHYDTLQDYLASGCTMQLTDEELDYYNALYALVGIHRKYGKDNAIAFLMHPPFNVPQAKAQRMYAEALNLFYLNDTVENDAYRNIIFDNLQKAALAVLQEGRQPCRQARQGIRPRPRRRGAPLRQPPVVRQANRHDGPPRT